MKKKHMILELPAQDADLERILDDPNHDVKWLSFSSAAVDNDVKHFVFIIWHDAEYGDHMF